MGRNLEQNQSQWGGSHLPRLSGLREKERERGTEIETESLFTQRCHIIATVAFRQSSGIGHSHRAKQLCHEDESFLSRYNTLMQFINAVRK